MTTAARQDVRSTEAELPGLMIRYQGGEAAAVDELVRRLSPLLLRFFCFSQVPVSEAEDLLQECWLRIHRSRHTYRPSEPVLPWIFAIARHTRLDGHRRRRRRILREVLVADPPERPGAPSGERNGEPEDLARLLQQLPESQREVLVMLKVSGMSLEDVARAMSSTTGAIKQKAHRAYARLRELLAKEQ
ncbi:MAG TPA: RNA polymerase sigma factor [Bryobacteraceae bacterium]|nr:RNA polymerase sigma factor [Bryobacteraceae bacterium]